MLQMDLGRRLSKSDPRDVEGITNVMSLLEGMGVDSEARTCRTFFIDGLAADTNLGTQVGVALLSHSVWAQRVDLRVRTPSRCFARLAYGYYPSVDILVDGAQVQPHVSSAGFVIIELDAGEHDIALRPRLSALRASLLWCSLFIVLGSTACYIRSCKSYR